MKPQQVSSQHPDSYRHAHDLQLLQDKVHLLLRGERGQDGVVAPAGQLGVVVRVLGRDDLQTRVAHQVPVFTTHIFWSGEKLAHQSSVLLMTHL